MKIHPDFWEEFMRAAYIVKEVQRRRIKNPYDKDPDKYRDLEVYDVFDWMRQELHNELPYSKERCKAIDAKIEREYAREQKKKAASEYK